MPRSLRTDVGGEIYHVLNRANARVQIFDNDDDYLLFEQVLEEAVEKYNIDLFAYCIMPNHWHLLLQTKKDGDLSQFMGWLTNTHTKRWHSIKGTTGEGHLYQGRYKSFICQDDKYFLTLARYVERNAKKANLVEKAENWPYSSIWRRSQGNSQQKKLLSKWPIHMPRNYLSFLDKPQNKQEEISIENAIKRGSPYGKADWQSKVVRKFNLQATVKPRGRPKKGG